MVVTAARFAAIGFILALGACADTPEAQTTPQIAWESDSPNPPATAPTESAEAQGAEAPRRDSNTALGNTASDASGCREFTQTVRVGGEEHQAVGRVCPQPDGSWRVVGLPVVPGQAPVSPPAGAYASPYRYPYYPYYRYYPYYPYYGSSVFLGSSFIFRGHRRHHHHHHHSGQPHAGQPHAAHPRRGGRHP